MSMGLLYALLGEVSIQILCPFFNWSVCLTGVELCEFLIYFGDYTLVSLANVLSHTVGSLFILMMVSLDVQKLFNLQSYLFIFPFISLALGDILAKTTGMWEV